jgi:UPF0755 protein
MRVRVTVALLVFAALAAVVAMIRELQPPARFGESRRVTLARGASLASAARELARTGVVRNAFLFICYAESAGGGARIKPGEYAFTGGESMAEVLRHLMRGDFMTVVVAIPEGVTVHQIGQRLQQAGLVCDSDFDAAAVDGPLPRALGLGTLGAEGFLFPATYHFSPSSKTDDIMGAMLARFYQLLTPAVEQRMFELGLDQRRLVTLASIVEKEAKVPGERPVIASVFFNRIAIGMPLQSDPTAEYNWAGELERAVTSIRAASAFNTYLIAGLPPGPIANPGWSSLAATLYPAHTDYLYFVARDDGTHIFSRTLRDHQHAIEELRRTAGRRPARKIPPAQLN